ncbi:hypothetical protein TNCV_2460561 [Trichonephila clavipes]|nr:hypothetical protein TNCV_2460561 [Trichonephila clavipes]
MTTTVIMCQTMSFSHCDSGNRKSWNSHPPYSPDMSPCDFNMFPKWKENLRGCRYHDVSSVRHALGSSVADDNN